MSFLVVRHAFRLESAICCLTLVYDQRKYAPFPASLQNNSFKLKMSRVALTRVTPTNKPEEQSGHGVVGAWKTSSKDGETLSDRMAASSLASSGYWEDCESLDASRHEGDWQPPVKRVIAAPSIEFDSIPKIPSGLDEAQLLTKQV